VTDLPGGGNGHNLQRAFFEDSILQKLQKVSVTFCTDGHGKPLSEPFSELSPRAAKVCNARASSMEANVMVPERGKHLKVHFLDLR